MEEDTKNNEFIYYNDGWNHLNYTNLDNDYQLSKMGQEHPEIFKLIRSKKFQDNFYNKHHNKTKEDDKKHNDNI